ncbi:MAG: response regulator transcription factor [Rhodothermales bacterium]
MQRVEQPALRDRRDVWIVEDNALFRTTVSDLIATTSGLRCSFAFGCCEDALQALADGALPDLLLMDISLPGMNGIECVRQIHTRAPALPVVMLTVHQDKDRIFQAVCAGATGYLLKSVPGDELIRSIWQVLAGGAAMDSQIARRVLEMFTRMASSRDTYALSDREREILQLLVDGLTKNAIASRLFLSPHTVDGHMRNIYGKLHVNNRTGAVVKALRENLV